MNSPLNPQSHTISRWDYSTLKNDAVVYYMVVSLTCTLYLEAMQTKFMTTSSLVKTSRASLLCKSTRRLRALWRKTRVPTRRRGKCSRVSTHLASSRAAHLTDYNFLSKTMQSGSTEVTYPEAYPFDKMLLFIKERKGIVKFFHSHHVAKAQLKEMRSATCARALFWPCPRRWVTIQQTCKAEETERRDFKNTIIGTALIALLKKAIAIIEQTSDLITKYQSNKVPILEVVSDLHRFSQAAPNAFEQPRH